MDDVDENDCCGNGCVNCILNIKPAQSQNLDRSGKQNILEKFTSFLLINKNLHVPEVPDVWELHFKSKHSYNKNFILDIAPGHHLMMRKGLTGMEKEQSQRNEIENKRKYLLRPYSPYWCDVTDMEFKILVNIIPNGPMSEYMRNLKINAEVEFRGLIGTFFHQLDEKGDKCLLIISQGVAIAPVIPIIDHILSNECDMTRIVHISCFKDLKHLFFREKLYNFCKYWNYKVHIYLSKELCGNRDCVNNSTCLQTCKDFKTKLKYKEMVKSHRLGEDDFLEIVNNLNSAKENTFVIISGAGVFQNYFKELCQTTGNFMFNNIYLL